MPRMTAWEVHVPDDPNCPIKGITITNAEAGGMIVIRFKDDRQVVHQISNSIQGHGWLFQPMALGSSLLVLRMR